MKLLVKSYDGVSSIEVDVDSTDVPFDTLALKAKGLANISPEVPIMLFAEKISFRERIGYSPIGF